MTNDATYWHTAYEEAHHDVRALVDEVFAETRRIFKREGGKVAGDDRAEEFVAAIMRYSGNEENEPRLGPQ